MTSYSARSKCLYTLSLLYRWKSIRYMFLTAILFLIVIGISITELRHISVNFINSDDANDEAGIYRDEKIVDNEDYRVDLQLHDSQARFPFGKRILDRVGNRKVDTQHIIGVKMFANGEPQRFIVAPRDTKSNVGHGHKKNSFNFNYINSDIVGKERKDTDINSINGYLAHEQEKLNDVHVTFNNYVNDAGISIRGQPNMFKPHLIPNDAVTKGTYNATESINYKSNYGNQRKLNTVNSEKQAIHNLRGSSTTPSNKQLDEQKSRANELDSSSTTEKPMYDSHPPLQNIQSTAKPEAIMKKCTPVDNVIFLKTHKTGSSTIINIMQRYAHTHNLRVALPNVKHFLGWPNTFRQKYVFEHLPNMKYNILCNHARFHKERMLDIMASKNTKIVTIIRDPLYQFESSAVYLNFNALFNLNRSANLLDAFFNKSKLEIYNRTKKRNTHNIFLVKNPIAYDLGFPTWKENKHLVDLILEKVKKDFHLVMISDYMAESLVMLQEELCWDLQDIVFFTMNKRPDKLRAEIKDREKTRQKVNHWNYIDYRIFQHYNETFWKRVRQGGSKFQDKVKKLKGSINWLREKCLEPGRHFDKSQPWFPILGFKLKNEAKNFKYRTLCENMIRSEIDYTNLLKIKQTRHNWTVPTNPPKKKKSRPSERLNRGVPTNGKNNNNTTNDKKNLKNPDTG